MTPIPVGIVGAGRSRTGLGPFLASFLEQAGCRVLAVAGASPERAQRNALDLGQRLAHPVQGCRDLSELAAAGIAAMVISSPVAFHLDALQTALAAGLPVLCEKPLVDEHQLAEGLTVIDAYRRARILLAENCQWPFALPTLMHHSSVIPPFRQVALGFAPPRTGRAMACGLLPHLLSVIQALAPLDHETRVEETHWDRPRAGTELSVLRFRLRGPSSVDLAASLHQLEVSQRPPRPFWVEVNRTRFVRQVAADYSFAFACGGREFPVADPMTRLVQRFAGWLKEPDHAAIDREAGLVRQRLQLYQTLLAELGEEPPGLRHGQSQGTL